MGTLDGRVIALDSATGKVVWNTAISVTDGTDRDSADKLAVSDIAAFDFSRVDLVFFCGRSALSERYAEAAAEHAWVIDGSAAFRARADVPLVAADVNPKALDSVGERGLIADAVEQVAAEAQHLGLDEDDDWMT